MKRKFLTLFLALAASVGTIFAQSGTWGTNCTWKVENGVLTFSGTGALANMTETIAPWANYSPTSAIVNEGITSVGGRIFQGCSLLTEVTLAQSVTALGDRPFNNCSKLVTIICKAVTPPTCNTNTFYSIDKTKVTIYVPGKAYGAYQHADVWIDFADNFKAIPYGTCGDKLTWKVENGVLTISGTGDMWDFINEHPDEGWELCEPTKIVIEEGVTSIGKYAFDLCEKVDSVFIPSTVTKIGTHGLENKAIKIITCLAIVPPTCEVAAFTAENKTIYVPLESLEDYKNADIWKSNSKILPITGLKIYATLDDTGTKLTLDYTNDPEGKAVDFWPSELFPNVTTMELKPSMQDARPTKLDAWFDNYTKLTTIEHLEYLNTSEVTDMSFQFQNCWALKELDLSTFDTKNVTNMEIMFYGCEALESLNLTGWNTEKVTNMKSMFGYCEKLKELDLTSFNTEKTENVEYMFQECKELTTIYSNSDWTTPNRPIKSERMFEGCVKLVGGNGTAYDATKIDHTYARPDKEGQPGYFTEDVLKVYTEFVESTGTLTYYYDGKYRKRTGIIEDYDPANNLNIPERFKKYYDKITRAVIDESMKEAPLTSARAMFYGGGVFGEYRLINLTIIDSLSYLNTSIMTDMSSMFLGCKALQIDNYTYDAIANFNTQNVTDMSYMFEGCKAIDYINVSKFNTQNVTSMYWMFRECESLKVLDLRNFDVQNVTKLGGMFKGCKALETILCNEDWSVKAKKVDRMGSNEMFEGCEVIKGGNGTMLDKNNVNIKFARPDKKGQPGYFTERATGIDNVSASKRNEATKFIRNCQLFIQRDGKTYNAEGKEVK